MRAVSGPAPPKTHIPPPIIHQWLAGARGVETPLLTTYLEVFIMATRNIDQAVEEQRSPGFRAALNKLWGFCYYNLSAGEKAAKGLDRLADSCPEMADDYVETQRLKRAQRYAQLQRKSKSTDK